jgi:RHS repeat-associated protein
MKLIISRKISMSCFFLLLSAFCFFNCSQSGKRTTNAITPVPGTIAGDFLATKSGSSAYKIPLPVPPGINGMQPELALLYSHQQRNGKLGLGWQISGLSTIERCKAIIAVDGFAGGINYDVNDRFSLDGGRLINITGNYGSDRTVYHTEIESWKKIQSAGKSGNGPDHFVVTTKDGTIMEYGNTGDSRIKAAGRDDVRVWALNKITDRNGNKMTITYTSSPVNINTGKNIDSTGEYYPFEIAYTANDNVNPNRFVRFNYAARQDVLTAYQGGAVIRTSARLVSISTYVSSNLISEFVLQYQLQATTLDYSKIASITATGPNQKLPATVFTYQQGTNTLASPAVALNKAFSINDGWSDQNTYPITMVDVNGDGIMDIVGFKKDTQVSLGIANPSPGGPYFSAPQSWSADFGNNKGWSRESVSPRYVTDVNGDGMADVVAFGMNGILVGISTGKSFDTSLWNDGKVFPYYNTANGWNNPGLYPVTFADINGDHLTDIVGFKNGIQVALSNGKKFECPVNWGDSKGSFTTDTGWTADNIRILADVNGDGRADIIGFDNDGVHVGLSTGTNFDMTTWNGGQVYSEFGTNQGWSSLSSYPITVGDVNGDGLTDIIGFKQKVTVALSTGTTFIASLDTPLQDFTTDQGWTSGDPRYLSDMNGDGKIDIVGINKDGVKVALSTGSTFDAGIWNGGQVYPNFGYNQGYDPGKMKTCITDFTGDGITDIAVFGENAVIGGINPGVMSGLLSEVTNGIGKKNSIVYAPISDPDVYQKIGDDLTTDARYYFTASLPINMSIPVYSPLILNGGQLNVIKSSTTEDVSSDNGYPYSHQFAYANAGFDLNGRGWQGFERFTEENTTHGDPTGGWKSTLTSWQTFPFTGKIKRLLIQSAANSTDPKTGSGNILSGRTVNYLGQPGSNTGDNIYQPYPGVYQVLPQANITDYYNYNAYKFSTARKYNYDRYGNTTVYADLNYTDQSGKDLKTSDNVYTLKKYRNDVSGDDWTLGYPTVELVSTNNDLSRLVPVTPGSVPAYQNGIDFQLQAYAYDDHGNLKSKGAWDNGEKTSVWLTYTYEYDRFGNRTKIKDPAGNVTLWNYETVYNTYPDKEVTPPNNKGRKFTCYYGYDPGTGIRIASIDPNGNTTITVLDDFERTIAGQGPVPEDPAGIIASDNATSSLVTGSGNFKNAKVITLQTSRYLSDSNGLYEENSYLENWPTASISAKWSWNRSYSDAFGRTLKFISSKGPCDGKGNYTINFSYDCNNNLINRTLPYFEGDPVYHETISYDGYNRILQTISPAGIDGKENSVTKYSYEITGTGLTAGIMTASGDACQYGQNLNYQFFNSGDQLASMVVPGDNNATTTYGYDVLGRPVNSVSPSTQDNPAGLTSTVTYDSLGRHKQIYNPSQGRIDFYYDKEGKLAKKTDAGGRAEFVYDKLSRVNRINWYEAKKPDEVFCSETFEYDNSKIPNGLLKRTGSRFMRQDGTVESEYKYSKFDEYGNNIEIALKVSDIPGAFTTKKQYDPGNRLTNYTYPDGHVMSKEYSSCYLQQVNLDGQNYIAYSDYTAAGSPQTITLANGVTSKYAYDPSGNLRDYQVKDKNDTSFWHNSYAWNHLNNIDSISDLDGQGIDYSQSFFYENLRLTGAVSGGTYGTINYDYDQAGNLTLKDGVSYDYQGYQVKKGTKNSKTVFIADYDAMGNMTDVSSDMGDFKYEYNPMNLLTVASNAKTNAVTSFSYDNYGRRIKKTGPDGTITIYVSDLYRVIRKPDKSTITKKYLDGLVGKEVEITSTAGKPDTILYIHQNQVGSTLFTTDSSGKMANLMFYKPYGELMNTSTDAVDPKFTGKEYDDSTGLYYFGARYYNPFIGRFITADNGLGGEKTRQDTFNRYQYVLGNPIVYNDPSGNMSCKGAIGGGSALGVFGGASLYYTIQGENKNQAIGFTAGFEAATAIAIIHNCDKAQKWGIEQKIINTTKSIKDGIGNFIHRITHRESVQDFDGLVDGDIVNSIVKNEPQATTSNGKKNKVKDDAGDDKQQEGDKTSEQDRDPYESQKAECSDKTNCFTAGTLINVPEGTKPIESIKKGDMVFSYNETTGVTSIMPVIECYKRVSMDLVILKVRGQTVETTPEHPFYVKDRGWVKSKDMVTGDMLITMTGSAIPVDQIEVKKGRFTVYNFSVDINHTYYITPLALLVHNICGTGTRDGMGGKTNLGKGDMTENSLDSGTGIAEIGAETGAEAGADAGMDTVAVSGVEAGSGAAEIGADIAVEAGADMAEAGEIALDALMSLLLLL